MIGAVALIGTGLFGCPRLPRAATPTVRSRTELSQFDPSIDRSVFLEEPGREGWFVWHADDLSAAIARDPLQGIYVPGCDMSGGGGAWVRKGPQLRPEMFGAGTSGDTTEAVQAMFHHLGPGCEAVLSRRYIISRELAVTDQRGFTLSGGGTIVAEDGMAVAWGFGLIRLTRCADFTIRDLRFDGNRQNRRAAQVPAHSVIFDSCSDFLCERVRSDNAVVDGFIILSETPLDAATHCRNFRMVDCHAENCFRQGCSVIQGHQGLFLRGSYTRTNGTDPSAGIDLESDQGNPLHSITQIRFEEVLFEGNAGFGLLVPAVSHPRDIEVVNCRFVNNRLGAISWGSQTGRIVSPYIEGFSDAAFRGAIDVPVGIQCAGLTISEATFRNVTAIHADRRLVYVHGGSGGNVTVMGIDVDRCAGIVSFWAPRCRLLDSPRIEPRNGSANGAILVQGDDCEVSGNTISHFFGAVIFAEGARFQARQNILAEPRFNDAAGCIRAPGRAARITDNVFRVASGSRIVSADAPALLARNRVEVVEPARTRR